MLTGNSQDGAPIFPWPLLFNTSNAMGNYAIIGSPETGFALQAVTDSSGSWAATTAAPISVAPEDSALVETFFGSAGSPAGFVAPPVDTTTVTSISAPEANQSQIWAVTNTKSGEDSSTTFVQAENILFEANPNINMDIGPAAVSVYNVAADNAAVTTSGIEESGYTAGNYVVTGSAGSYQIQSVVAEPAGANTFKLEDGSSPQDITNLDYTNITGGNTVGTYKQSYEMKESQVASDSFNVETVTVNLSSALGSEQQLFWQINVDGGANSASMSDFVETNGYVMVGATDTSVDIKVKVVNDGDQDEKAENFTVDLGYVIGPNKIESVDLALSAEDGTNKETTAATVGLTPTLATGETVAADVLAPSTTDHIIGTKADG